MTQTPFSSLREKLALRVAANQTALLRRLDATKVIFSTLQKTQTPK